MVTFKALIERAHNELNSDYEVQRRKKLEAFFKQKRTMKRAENFQELVSSPADAEAVRSELQKMAL
jgi:hypothetical protein